MLKTQRHRAHAHRREANRLQAIRWFPTPSNGDPCGWRHAVLLCATLTLSFVGGCKEAFPAQVPAGETPFVCQSDTGGDWESMRTDPTRFIAHAGGGHAGPRYTNSLQAAEASIARGFQLLELDLHTTRDGHIAAVHDWDEWGERTGRNTPPTHEEFMAEPCADAGSPMDMVIINKFFARHAEAILVSDKIRDMALLQQFAFPGRLIIEVFSLEDYQRALDAGFKYPMLSLYKAGGSAVLNTVIQSKMPLVAVATKRLERYAESLTALRQQGACIFAFTTNDDRFFHDHLDKTHGVYTDSWHVLEGRCETAPCDTY